MYNISYNSEDKKKKIIQEAIRNDYALCWSKKMEYYSEET
jgi:hypothetical protein